MPKIFLLLTALLLTAACLKQKKDSHQPQAKPNYRVVLQFDFPDVAQRDMLLDSAQRVLTRRIQDVFVYSSLSADATRQTVTIDLLGKLFPSAAPPSDSVLEIMSQLLSAEGRLDFYATYRWGDAGLPDMVEFITAHPQLPQLIRLNTVTGSAVIGYAAPGDLAAADEVFEQLKTAGKLPATCLPAWSTKPYDSGSGILHELYFLAGPPRLSGADLRKVAVRPPASSGEGPGIELEFNADGARRWESITTAAVQAGNREIAVVFDGRVLFAPRVMSAITTGQCVIANDFTPAEATSLAHLLQAGALPGPARVVEAQILR